MKRQWHAIVVVPARDEAAVIARCVRSVRRAAMVASPLATFDIVVVADSCRDDTAGTAARALGRAGIVLPCSVGTAGAARRIGVDVALRRSPMPTAHTWIANTDADTAVPPMWLVTQLRWAARGADAVAGVVRLHRGGDRSRKLRRDFESSYLVERDGTHGHVHGANLGVRADAYLAVGGWDDIATGEDHDLWRRMSHRHAVISTSASFVRTSARRIGRAPDGFAADLVALAPTLAVPT